jgi:hypothetical protein
MIRSTILLSAIVAFASLVYADDLKPYQTGKLLQMESVPCSAKSQGPLCLQYVLEADSVVFHIRPKSVKHAIVLPVGERAQFRIEKGKILMHMDGVDNTERQYVVVSLAPRTESSSADAAPVRLNHLQ